MVALNISVLAQESYLVSRTKRSQAFFTFVFEHIEKNWKKMQNCSASLLGAQVISTINGGISLKFYL